MLIYGIAEASTAYLITKITEPPPPPSEADKFKEQDMHWKNKHEFLNLPLEKLDKFNVSAFKKGKERPDDVGSGQVELEGKKFT